MRVERRGAGSFVFIFREQAFELLIFICPVGFAAIKGSRKAAPSDVLAQSNLFVGRGVSSLGYAIFNDLDSFDIGLEARFFPGWEIKALTDHKVCASRCLTLALGYVGSSRLLYFSGGRLCISSLTISFAPSSDIP